MPEVFNVCLIQPDGYIHSGAFFEIADLIVLGLRELGFKAALRRNAIDPDARNILIGIHLLDPSFADGLPPDTIILNTEQLGGSPEAWNKNILEWFSKGFTLWDYSDANVGYLRSFGVEDVRKFQIGFQKELCRIDKQKEKDVDVLFYGSLNQRRRIVLADLQSRGLQVKVLNGVYGRDRDDWIGRSRIVLNHHYYETQIFEIVRAFYLMTNGVPVAAEVNPETQIDDRYRDGLLCLPYAELAGGIAEILKDGQELEQLGTRGKATIGKHPQAEILRELI
jgi:hypothetical protein